MGSLAWQKNPCNSFFYTILAHNLVLFLWARLQLQASTGVLGVRLSLNPEFQPEILVVVKTGPRLILQPFLKQSLSQRHGH